MCAQLQAPAPITGLPSAQNPAIKNLSLKTSRGRVSPVHTNKWYISAAPMSMSKRVPFWDCAATQVYINMVFLEKNNSSLNLKPGEGSRQLGCRNSHRGIPSLTLWSRQRPPPRCSRHAGDRATRCPVYHYNTRLEIIIQSFITWQSCQKCLLFLIHPVQHLNRAKSKLLLAPDLGGFGEGVSRRARLLPPRQEWNLSICCLWMEICAFVLNKDTDFILWRMLSC